MSETELYEFLEKLILKYDISNFWVILKERSELNNKFISIKSYLYYNITENMFVWDWDWNEGGEYMVTDVYILDVLKNPNLNLIDFHYSAKDIKEKKEVII